jgi:membrane protein implicated in regulation of membrane protease activity
MTIDFISWLVFGALCLFAEFAIGTRYLIAIGFAFIYPSIASFLKAPTSIQLVALMAGITVHVLALKLKHKEARIAPPPEKTPDIGERVEVIEWIDEDAARVRYQGEEWQAEKLSMEMPCADHGVIQRVQYGRLFISTGEYPEKK